MTESMYNRACKALTETRTFAGMFFTKVYVVDNELTFSKNVAERMLKDAKLVRCCELRQINRNRYFDIVPEDITSITIEEVDFETAYKKVFKKEVVPLEIIKMVYHEMDDIHVYPRGGRYIKEDEKKDYERAKQAVKEFKHAEKEKEDKRKADKKARAAANKKLREERKAAAASKRDAKNNGNDNNNK